MFVFTASSMIAFKTCLARLLMASMLLATIASVGFAQSSDLPRIGDAAGVELSPETERRIGQAIMRGLRRDGVVLEDLELNSYLNGLASALVETPQARAFQFEFFLLEDSSLNAFALPGGFIGAHTGLVRQASTESELASVLAHEIGHVTQRHIARMLAQNERSSIVSIAAVFLALLAASADSSGDAVAGIVALGSSVQAQQMLSFSRDAEREADRVGLEILRDANFNPRDMVSFFGRLQKSNSIYESGAPSYLRTHPLTTERMADIQNRVLENRYRQRVDSIDFRLAKEKIAFNATADAALSERRQMLLERLDQRTFLSEAATFYGIALVAAKQQQWEKASEALANARKSAQVESNQTDHPFFARLAIDIELQRPELDRAIELADQSIERFPRSVAIRFLRVQALVKAKRYKQAIAQIEEDLLAYRSQPKWWQLMGEAYAATDKIGLSHWATGERYALLGGFSAALTQFQLARKDKSIDFYRLSRIDSRIADMRREILDEKKILEN
jgi:predicted Zn-dependent protease